MIRQNIPSARKEDIIELAEIVAQNYVTNDNQINPESIADDKNIQYCYKDYGKYFDGMLHYMNERFFIFCNLGKLKNKKSSRARFTFSHELGHYFIIEHRHALQRGENLYHPSQCHFSSKVIIEKEADLFATHLLMPTFLFQPLIKRKKRKQGIEEILYLKNLFNTSITSTALRYIKSNINNNAIIIWDRKGKLKWYWTSKGFQDMNLGRIIDDAKFLFRGSATQQVLKQEEINFTIRRAGTTVSTVFKRTTSRSCKNAILLEEAVSLGKYGVLTLIYTDGNNIDYKNFN